MSLPLLPCGNKVLIKADVEDHAPETTDSGLVLAKTLAAAVEGSDVEDSWFVGTIVAVGPLVNHFDVRAYVLRRLRQKGGMVRLLHLIAEIEGLPAECPDPLKVGDRVTFSWASGQQINVDGDKYLVMAATDVLAVLQPELEAV